MVLIVVLVWRQEKLRLVPCPGGLSLPLPLLLGRIEISWHLISPLLLLDLPILTERIRSKIDKDLIQLPLLNVDLRLNLGFQFLDQD